MKPSRSGMTILELLVVISIIGILTSLILPAVQYARATARKTQCANSLRQLGVALTNYESQHRHFPAGKNALDHSQLPELSWMGSILGNLERVALANDIRDAYTEERSPYLIPPHIPITRPVVAFQCAADSRVKKAQSASTLNGARVGLTSYLGISGVDHTDNTGILYYGSKTTTAAIRDGLSNTLLVGERPPSSDYNLGWWYTGAGQDGSGNCDVTLGTREIPTIGGLLSGCSGEPGFREGNIDEFCDALHFWSLHAGGANFLFADGRVQFMNYESAEILPALATRAGGEPTQPDQFD